MPAASEQGTTYAAFIDDQLKAELARRSSLDERGTKLQQSASVTLGLFVTAMGLLLGKDQPLVGVPLWLLVASGVVLLGAFLCGVIATRLISYEMADEETFDRMLGPDHWPDTQITSRNITASLNAKTVTSMRPGNDRKAAFLSYGIWAQGVGVLLGGAAFVVAAATLMGTPTSPVPPTLPATMSSSASPSTSTHAAIPSPARTP